MPVGMTFMGRNAGVVPRKQLFGLSGIPLRNQHCRKLMSHFESGASFRVMDRTRGAPTLLGVAELLSIPSG
jgi:hypothetical protein